ncbi:MAG: hypothetical protein HZB24_10405, partial [Desulfobacterales bacterium]|nr:hypothetical protein [Desulfobacterales bacterium]
MIPRFHGFIGVSMLIGLLAITCATQGPMPAPAVQETRDPLDEAIASGDWETARMHYEQLLTRSPKD